MHPLSSQHSLPPHGCQHTISVADAPPLFTTLASTPQLSAHNFCSWCTPSLHNAIVLHILLVVQLFGRHRVARIRIDSETDRAVNKHRTLYFLTRDKWIWKVAGVRPFETKICGRSVSRPGRFISRETPTNIHWMGGCTRHRDGVGGSRRNFFGCVVPVVLVQ